MTVPAWAWLPLAAGLLAAAALCLWVLRPLWRGGRLPLAEDDAALALLGRREAVLAGLRDLDADHASGRLDDETYGPLRDEAMAEGRRVLAALDRALGRGQGERAARLRRIEAAVLARRGVAGGGVETGSPPAAPCPACGEPVAAADRYCRACGAALGEGPT